LDAPSKKLRETSEDSLENVRNFWKMRETLHFWAQKEFSDQSWLHIIISNSGTLQRTKLPAYTPFKITPTFVAVSCCLKYGRNMQNLFTCLLQVLQLLQISQFTSIPE
jgi:hypothetical protein